MARYPAASSFAPIPFDKHGVPGTIEIVDDFVTATPLADAVDGNGAIFHSEYEWLASEIAGGAVSNITIVAAVDDHPGVISLNVGATTPADGDAAALQLGGDVDDSQEMFNLDTNGVYIAAVLRIPDVDAQIIEFGLAGQAPAVPNSSAADIVSFVWDPEDAANVGDELFLCQVNGAGTDVEAATSLVPYVQNDWVLLEIAADSSSATFRITTEDNTQTIQLTAADGVVMPTVGLRPVFSVENVGSAEELLAIDLFVLRYLRRDALVAGWLGA